MSGEKDVAPKEGKSNFERTTEKIIKHTDGDRVNPRDDISRDNEGKIVGAEAAHRKGVRDANQK